MQARLDVAEEQLFKWKTRCEKAERDLKMREGEWESSHVNLVCQRYNELAQATATKKNAEWYHAERDDARWDWEACEQQVEELTTSKDRLSQDIAAACSTLLKLQTDFGTAKRELDKIRAEGAYQQECRRVKVEAQREPSATTSRPPGSCSTQTRSQIQTTTSTRRFTHVLKPAWSA